LTREEAVVEVEHLQKLLHSHIVRVEGTYTLKKDLAILLYPAADYNLEQYMDDIVGLDTNSRLEYLAIFPGCLARTIQYLHENNVKHMDIKPRNILIRDLNQINKRYKVSNKKLLFLL
jgi:serine/threonine protein kinase